MQYAENAKKLILLQRDGQSSMQIRKMAKKVAPRIR